MKLSLLCVLLGVTGAGAVFDEKEFQNLFAGAQGQGTCDRAPDTKHDSGMVPQQSLLQRARVSSTGKDAYDPTEWKGITLYKDNKTWAGTLNLALGGLPQRGYPNLDYPMPQPSYIVTERYSKGTEWQPCTYFSSCYSFGYSDDRFTQCALDLDMSETTDVEQTCFGSHCQYASPASAVELGSMDSTTADDTRLYFLNASIAGSTDFETVAMEVHFKCNEGQKESTRWRIGFASKYPRLTEVKIFWQLEKAVWWDTNKIEYNATMVKEGVDTEDHEQGSWSSSKSWSKTRHAFCMLCQPSSAAGWFDDGPIARNYFTVQPQVDKVNTLRIEVSRKNLGSKVSISSIFSIYATNINETWDKCMAGKMEEEDCLKKLDLFSDPFRSDHHAQMRCLESGAANHTTCGKWLGCLSQHKERELLKLLKATVVETTTTSTTTSTRRIRARRIRARRIRARRIRARRIRARRIRARRIRARLRMFFMRRRTRRRRSPANSLLQVAGAEDPPDRATCISPTSADPEAWDCDCIDSFKEACEDSDLQDHVCYKTHICKQKKVCEEWKKQAGCEKHLSQTLVQKYTKKRALLLMEQRSLRKGHAGELEDTTKRKCVV